MSIIIKTSLAAVVKEQLTSRYGYNVARMISAISGCIRRCMLSCEEAMGLVPAVDGSIMRSINDSSKRYNAPISVSTESAISFTWGL